MILQERDHEAVPARAISVVGREVVSDHVDDDHDRVQEEDTEDRDHVIEGELLVLFFFCLREISTIFLLLLTTKSNPKSFQSQNFPLHMPIPL